MSVTIILAANSIAANEVSVTVPDDRALAYLEALAMLDNQRQASGTTPLTIKEVQS
jgi:hypothetical protein